MAEDENGGQRISYTVKELLGQQMSLVERIDVKLDEVARQLSTKADATEVAKLRAHFEILDATTIKREGPLVVEFRQYEKAVDNLKAELKGMRNARLSTRWWVTGPVMFSISILVSLGTIVLSHVWR